MLTEQNKKSGMVQSHYLDCLELEISLNYIMSFKPGYKVGPCIIKPKTNKQKQLVISPEYDQLLGPRCMLGSQTGVRETWLPHSREKPTR